MYDPDETALILSLASAGGCSLNEKAGSNWVEEGGGLPNYICKIAKELKKGGKSTSQAIAIAVSQVKRWAAGGSDVKADTKAKAAKALAQWEALKAKSKGKQVVRASNGEGSDYIFLSQPDVGVFNTDLVRQAWETMQRREREKARIARAKAYNENPYGGDDTAMAPDLDYPYLWIKELWTSHIIVEAEGKFLRIPYVVKGDEVVFGAAEKVQATYVEVPANVEFVDDELTEEEMRYLVGLANKNSSALSLIMSLSAPVG